MGWAGFNCSIPHKVTVIGQIDGLAESARIIGAVNCVVIRDGVMTGENTDGQGFVGALRTMREPGRGAGMRARVPEAPRAPSSWRPRWPARRT